MQINSTYIEVQIGLIMGTAFISPTILKWARERAHFDIEELAHVAHVKEEKLESWETGDSKPTFNQAQKLAHTLHIPFGYFFLSEPPQESLQIPDLRTLDDNGLDDISVDLRDVISDAVRKQDWYRDYLKEEGEEPLPFIGKYTESTNTAIIADDITKALALTIDDRHAVSNWENYLRLLINKAEDIGICILRNSKVGNNTRRILNVEEFRGFALCDPIAPLIFLNGSDAKAAQIFTLLHEITHLWIGESGISDVGVKTDTSSIDNAIELKCNEVAAEVLVPASQLRVHWKRGKTVAINADANARFFRVSPVVVARRALDLHLISRNEFFKFYKEQQEIWRHHKDKMRKTEGGPSFYTMVPIANGRNLTDAVLTSVYSQNTLMRDGARILGLKTSTLDNFAKERGIQ